MSKRSPFSMDYDISDGTDSKVILKKDESIASHETDYDISDGTDSKVFLKEDESIASHELKNELFKKIKSEYKLSKPRRNIIRAKIISE